jgi:large subunit ribosomal protein L35
MPKLKPHKASLKRFTITASGKVLAHPTGGRHMMSGKSSKKRRHIRRKKPILGMDRVHTLKALHVSHVFRKKASVASPAAAPAAAPKPEGA